MRLLTNGKGIIKDVASELRQQRTRSAVLTQDTQHCPDAIVDSCRVPSCAIYEDQGSFLTWSVVYDSGALLQLCRDGKITAYDLMNQGEPLAASEPQLSGALLDAIRGCSASHTRFRSSTCATGKKPMRDDLPVYDQEIVGQFLFGVTWQPVILAHRAQLNKKLGSDTVCAFGIQEDLGRSIAVGSAPTRKMILPVYNEWINICRAKRFTEINQLVPYHKIVMRTYCELVARHWGDLGMVIDASCLNRRCIITHDQMMSTICAVLNAKCAIDDVIIYPNAVSVERIELVNTGSIFSSQSLRTVQTWTAKK